MKSFNYFLRLLISWWSTIFGRNNPTLSPTPAPQATPSPQSASPITAVPTFPQTIPPVPGPEPLQILINCGGPNHVETTLSGRNRTWMADQYFVGGYEYASDPSTVISNTDNPTIYRTERSGVFKYEIPVPTGTYDIKIHFAELADYRIGSRVFNMDVEGKLFTNLDILALASNQLRTAITIDVARVVEDGAISIDFIFGTSDFPKVSAIEISLVAPHLAHAVTGTAPYRAVDIRNEGRVDVLFDGSTSHTHGVGLVLTKWIWEIEGTNSNVIGMGQTPTISVPVGFHTVTLLVVDSGGNEATERTTVTVYPYGYPAITDIFPDRGSIAGNELVRITGSGFTYSASQTIVHFGLVALTGSRVLTIVNSTTILLRTPPTTVGVPVSVTVETPLNTSTSVSYTYIASSEILFTSGKFFHFGSVTTGAFGPDGKFYVANFNGNIYKLTLNENFTQVVDQVSVVLSSTERRTVLGIAFDPNDVGLSNPPLYCSSSEFFHKGSTSSSGKSINGMIHRISGANFDVIENIVTGLPVSDHDHGLNGIVFGDSRELYIPIGSNTNGGVPGKISSSQMQKENYYSAAVLVAYINKPGFNGTITYDADDDGTPVGGSGVEIFTSGNRNAFGITLHSNGNLYVTDNGPNLGYGPMMTGCGEGMFKPDEQTQDRLDVLIRGKYYGHANHKRAIVDNDPRQCVWKNPSVDPSVVNGQEVYKAPLLIIPSSMGGIMEYTSDYFDRQLRGNLILSRYSSAMYRVILRPDGQGVIPQSDPALLLGIGEKCLSLTEAPDGTLIDIRYNTFSVFYHKPVESSTEKLKVYSVFPRRGHAMGGYILNIYGRNFDNTTSITIIGEEGGASVSCPFVPLDSSTLLQCTLPRWDGGSTVHIHVSKVSTGETYEFLRGFRYITGIP